MGKKVEIILKKCTYHPSVGKDKFISVSCFIPNKTQAVMSSPCDTPKEIHEAIEQYKKAILDLEDS